MKQFTIHIDGVDVTLDGISCYLNNLDIRSCEFYPDNSVDLTITFSRKRKKYELAHVGVDSRGEVLYMDMPLSHFDLEHYRKALAMLVSRDYTITQGTISVVRWKDLHNNKRKAFASDILFNTDIII